MPREKADIERLLKKYTIRKGTVKDFRPLHADVLIRLKPKQYETSSGLLLEERLHEEFQVGAEVVAVGHEQTDVKLGDRIVAEHNVVNGDILRWEDDDSDYELIGPKAVLAVLE